MFAPEWSVTICPYTLDPDYDAVCDATTHSDEGGAFCRLCEVKALVPKAINNIGQRKWIAIVRVPLPPPPFELASRGYYKMREIILTCGLSMPKVSNHLCEAPGGFLQATMEFSPGVVWKALSLCKLGAPWFAANLSHGVVSADIFDKSVCLPLLHQDACIVTADGATDIEHDNREMLHYPLLLAQTKIAANCLRDGGTFVIKFFEGGSPLTRRWIALLTTVFKEVSLLKPKSSRATNSERYLVAKGFMKARGADIDNVPPENMRVPPAWDQNLQALLDRFAEYQTQRLLTTLRTANARTRPDARVELPAWAITLDGGGRQ